MVGKQVRTALLNGGTGGGQLDEDDVAETRLSVVRNGHRSEASRIIIHNKFVVLSVALGCVEGWDEPTGACRSQVSDALTTVRTSAGALRRREGAAGLQTARRVVAERAD